ncbi:hypothetical protein DL93DRAFT_1089809 [Clavulina sp. PMI_390]|nr:hypothetical protein DL93DRAFT_1089809 [Clavulina sp. PMI_390]
MHQSALHLFIVDETLYLGALLSSQVNHVHILHTLSGQLRHSYQVQCAYVLTAGSAQPQRLPKKRPRPSACHFPPTQPPTSNRKRSTSMQQLQAQEELSDGTLGRSELIASTDFGISFCHLMHITALVSSPTSLLGDEAENTITIHLIPRLTKSQALYRYSSTTLYNEGESLGQDLSNEAHKRH